MGAGEHPRPSRNRIGDLMLWEFQAIVEEQKAEPQIKNVA